MLALAAACESDDCAGPVALFDVEGFVTINDQPAQGVTVAAGGKTTTTRADGGYRLTFEQGTPVPYVEVVPPAGVHFREVQRFVVVTSGASVSFEGYREAAVRGRVLAYGQPVPDVSLELLTSSGQATTNSAADGTYRFDAVPPSFLTPHWIRALSGPSGFEIGLGGSGITFQILGSDVILDIEGSFADGAVVSGSVTSGGVGLGGVIVAAVGPYSVADTTTPNGTYRLPPLPQGTYDVGIGGYDLTVHRFPVTRRSVTVMADTTVDFAGSPIVPNQPPTATIQQPATGASFQQGSAIAFQGNGTDPEDGALGGASLAWESSVDGLLGTGDALTITSLSVGTHTITLTATDAQGASGSAQIDVTVTSAPAVPGSISGSVTANGFGIGGVAVTLGGAASASTSTGEGGTYSFANLMPGTYTVAITNPFPGVTFPALSQTVTLGSGQNLTLDFAGTYGSGPAR